MKSAVKPPNDRPTRKLREDIVGRKEAGKPIEKLKSGGVWDYAKKAKKSWMIQVPHRRFGGLHCTTAA